VFTVPEVEDGLLRGFSAATCPKWGVAYKNQAKTAAWKEIEAEAGNWWEEASRITGMDVTLANTWAVHDVMVTEQAHGMPWAPGAGQAFFANATKYSDAALVFMYNSLELHRMTAGNLVWEMRQRLMAAATGTNQPGWSPSSYAAGSKPGTGPKLALYSAHDTTVAALASALGVWDEHNPPYGSSLVLELVTSHVGSNDTSDYAVRAWYHHGTADDVLFNATASLVTIPGCPSTLCPLPTFVSVTDPIAVEDWKAECGVSTAAPVKHVHVSNVVGGVIGGVIGLVVGAAVTLLVAKRNRSQDAEHYVPQP
jgi:hypothetical protein